MSDPCFVTPLPPQNNHVVYGIKVWIARCLDHYVHCMDDLVTRLSKGERDISFLQNVRPQDAAVAFERPKAEFGWIGAEIVHMLELNPIGNSRPNQKVDEFVLEELRPECEEGIIATSR